MRELEFIVGVDSVSPSSVQDGGVLCEYNATKLNFTLDEILVQKLAQQEGNLMWSIEVIDCQGNLSVHPVEFGENTACFILPMQSAMAGSTAQLQLVATFVDEDYIMLEKQYFPIVKVKFGPSVTSMADSNEYDRYADNLIGAMGMAVSAMEKATLSAEEAKTAEERAYMALQSAEGIAQLCEETKRVSEQIYQSEEMARQASITAQGYRDAALNAESGACQAEVNARLSEEKAYEMALAATAAAEDAISAVADNWQLYKEVVLENSVIELSEQVESLGDTKKGVRVKVVLPANTTLPNNRLTAYINLNNNRRIDVRGEGWTTSSTATVCYFDIRPYDDVWNAEIVPYAKTISGITGDLTYAEGDYVRYIKLKTNETNPIPAGTKIEI